MMANEPDMMENSDVTDPPEPQWMRRFRDVFMHVFMVVILLMFAIYKMHLRFPEPLQGFVQTFVNIALILTLVAAVLLLVLELKRRRAWRRSLGIRAILAGFCGLCPFIVYIAARLFVPSLSDTIVGGYLAVIAVVAMVLVLIGCVIAVVESIRGARAQWRAHH